MQNLGTYCLLQLQYAIQNQILNFQLNYIKEIHSSSIKLESLYKKLIINIIIQRANQIESEEKKRKFKNRKKYKQINYKIKSSQKMNFDNCNYVISNASSLISSLLNQAQQASTNSETGYQASTDDLMGREASTNGGSNGMFGNFFEMIIIIVGFLFIYSLLGNYINNRRNKLNQKPRANHDDNNRDRDTSSVN
ncbi:hypothetical protein ABPG74_010674 [Tetrahymena malaccensis]